MMDNNYSRFDEFIIDNNILDIYIFILPAVNAAIIKNRDSKKFMILFRSSWSTKQEATILVYSYACTSINGINC